MAIIYLRSLILDFVCRLMHVDSCKVMRITILSLALCTDEKGISKNGKPLHYKGTTFHHVIPRRIFNGGYITDGDGLKGESINGDSFVDENFINKCTGPEILSMANTGLGTNGSQFLICTVMIE
ncbi:hypothetical protein Ddye_023796 [Dipteronia dyeriana]|uniref:Peptidyl-prolyl cis-trans isomerase n=1 Tax=Dipteronia dyeriana TaxID=168575 RepID=A0AAD9WTK7_9ROSI|nr:hypothetical protein Ddye_023796 [Dipteronia dyeriana]